MIIHFVKNTASVLVLVMAVAGCTTTQRATTTGVLVGAGLGAVIGHQSGEAVTGAIIGGVIGGVIGYMVGRSRTEAVASASATAQSQNYSPSQGLVVRQTEQGVSPSIVSPGENVDLTVTLAVMAPDAQENVSVRQRIQIYKGTTPVGSIVEDNFTLKPGTHRLTRTITLQRDAIPGQYTFVNHIRATTALGQVSETSGEVFFTVR